MFTCSAWVWDPWLRCAERNRLGSRLGSVASHPCLCWRRMHSIIESQFHCAPSGPIGRPLFHLFFIINKQNINLILLVERKWKTAGEGRICNFFYPMNKDVEIENRVCSTDKWKLFGGNLIFDTDRPDLYHRPALPSNFWYEYDLHRHLACVALFSTLQNASWFI